MNKTVRKLLICLPALALSCAAPAGAAEFETSEGTTVIVEPESADTEKAIGSVENEIKALEAEINSLEEEKDSYVESMRERIVYMYTYGSSYDMLEALLGSESFAEALSMAQFQQGIYDYDAAQMEEYRAVVQDLNDSMEELEERLADLEGLKDEQEDREKGIAMLETGYRYIGAPYAWGGSTPAGFDCSGFVIYCANNSGNGWSLPRASAEGIRSKYCEKVPDDELQPGDLVFFQGTYRSSGATHVGIYVGDGMMMHASGGGVKISSMETPYWSRHYMQAGRLV